MAKRKINQPSIENLTRDSMSETPVPTEMLEESAFDETAAPITRPGFKEAIENANAPENGLFGELHIYCGREKGECSFRAFEKSSPSGLLWSCLRCRDMVVKLDNNVV